MSVAELIAFADGRGMAVRVTVWPDGAEWIAHVQCKHLDGRGATPRWECRDKTASIAADRAAELARWYWDTTLGGRTM